MDTHHVFNSTICGSCGNIIRIPVYCGNRFCTECGRTRQRKVRHKLKLFVRERQPASTHSFKHLTLTVVSDDDLTAQVAHLVRSFRRFRQRAYVKKNVAGGAFVVEITHSDSGWHAHIHAIIESAYMPWGRLLALWTECSGGTGIFIKRIPVSAIVKYLTKYITKSDLEADLQFVASAALKGSRLFQPFGQWHNPINAIKVPLCVCGQCGYSDWYFGDLRTFIAGCKEVIEIVRPPPKTPVIYPQVPMKFN